MMLESFSVTNYKNFEKTVTVDFSKTKNYSFNSDLIKEGLINKALVIGTNGSGKTNLGRAVFDIVYTLTDCVAEQEPVDEISFINGDSDSHVAEFVYVFRVNGSRFTYTYRKTSPKNIVYESLRVGADILFIRGDGEQNYLNLDMIGAENLRMDNIQNGPLSVLRYIHNNTVQASDSPVSLIMRFVEGMLYFRSTQDGNRFIGLMKGGETLEKYIIDNGLIGDFERFIRDTGKVEMRLGSSKGPFGDLLVQRTGKKELLFGTVASSGTKALLLFYYWMKHSRDITFLYMDEFDAFYHYELSTDILRRVCRDTNYQTMFTSHNTSLISNDILRPDCYMVLRDGKIRTFPELTERELRQGHNLEKMLRNGVFDD